MRTLARLAVLAALLSAGATACSDQPLVPETALDPPVLVTAPGHDLNVSLPDLGSVGADVGAVDEQDLQVVPFSGAAAPEEGDIFATIQDAKSWAWASSTQVGVTASTTFTGTGIRVDVWHSATFLGETIVSGLKTTTENSSLAPLNPPWGFARHTASSKSGISGTCGHTVWGRAQHKAYFFLKNMPFGSEEKPSYASKLSQPDCDGDLESREEGDGGSPGGTGGSGKDDEMGESDGDYMCYFMVWRDSGGRVVRVDFMGCF